MQPKKYVRNAHIFKTRLLKTQEKLSFMKFLLVDIVTNLNVTSYIHGEIKIPKKRTNNICRTKYIWCSDSDVSAGLQNPKLF